MRIFTFTLVLGMALLTLQAQEQSDPSNNKFRQMRHSQNQGKGENSHEPKIYFESPKLIKELASLCSTAYA